MSLLDGGLRFATPEALLALALMAAAGLLALRAQNARQGGGLLYPSVGLLRGDLGSLRARLAVAPTALRLVALVLLVLAVARPQMAGAAVAPGDTEGIDIVLVVDTSSSMTARDFAGQTRMEGAKRAMRAFVSGLKNDRVGVVIFSAEALQLSALTLDYEATDRVIEPLQAGRLLRDGTAIGTGMAVGLNVLKESSARSKVVVLFTDGENNAGDVSPLDAAEVAKLLGVRVYTVGAVGGSVSGVDERQLGDLAERTGARYFRATNEAGLLSIYQDVQRLEKSRLGRPRPAEWSDVYLVLVLGAAALLAAEVVLRGTLVRRVP